MTKLEALYFWSLVLMAPATTALAAYWLLFTDRFA